MKRLLFIAVAVAITGAAFAQDTTPPPVCVPPANTLPPLKMTTVVSNADGSTTSTTSEISGSFAFQTFGPLLAPAQMLGDGGVTRRLYLGFTDKNSNVFTLGPAGEVYRNGTRLYTTSSTGALQKMLAAKIVSFGNEIYALGKTNPTWFRWDGTATVNKWVTLPVDFDTSILN